MILLTCRGVQASRPLHSVVSVYYCKQELLSSGWGATTRLIYKLVTKVHHEQPPEGQPRTEV